MHTFIKPSILHVISSLSQGGAETVLFRLTSSTVRDFSHTVVSMMNDGVYGDRLRDLGVRVYTLGMPRGRVSASGIIKLRQCLKEIRPDIVQTWMYHADLLGGLAARMSGCRQVIWGIRHTNLERDANKATTCLAARICGSVSTWLPYAITCNSKESARVHQAFGYRNSKFYIIPNGFDLSRFRPDPEARVRLRGEWKTGKNENLFGFVARWDAQKDHANLFRALALLSGKNLKFRCILAGSGMCADNSGLSGMIRRNGLDGRIVLLGPRNDIPDVMNALDLHVISSLGEAFPNAVAEAMACGTPCVVTDVGDAAAIIGDTGWVVPPRDPRALADAIVKAVDVIHSEGRDILGMRCRKRIKDNYSMERMVESYKTVWRDALERVRN